MQKFFYHFNILEHILKRMCSKMCSKTLKCWNVLPWMCQNVLIQHYIYLECGYKGRYGLSKVGLNIEVNDLLFPGNIKHVAYFALIVIHAVDCTKEIR